MALPFLANFDHHTLAWWRNNNPTLGADEVGIECDAVDGGGNPIFAIDSATGWAAVRLKIGTGAARWNDLPYSNVLFLTAELVGATTKGEPGEAGTIDIVEVSTAPAGAQAQVVNAGTPHAAKLKITLPRGADGRDGIIRIAEVVTAPAGTPANVEDVGTDGDVALKITIPKGDPGRDGVLQIDDVVTAPAGTPATLAKDSDGRWVLSIPRGRDGTNGDDGATPTVTIGQVFAVDSAAAAQVKNVGTATDQVWVIYLPRGAEGPKGDPGLPGEGGITQWVADKDYAAKCLVWGDDGRAYEWLAPSGPGTNAGPQDPMDQAPSPVDASGWGGWVTAALPSNWSWQGVALNNAGAAVTVASGSTATARSADGGKTWEAGGALPASGAWSHCAINLGGRAIAIRSGINVMAYSIDSGQTWAASNAIIGAASNWRGAGLNNNGQAITVARNEARAAISMDHGQTWIQTVLPSTADWYDCAINDRGQTVAVANGSNKAAYSPGGGELNSWTASTLPTAAGAASVDINDLGHAVAAAYASTAAAYSRDGGATWASATLPSASIWTVRINNDDLCVAIGYSPLAVAYSRDGGQTWTGLALPPSPGYIAGCDLNNRGDLVTVYPMVTTAYSGTFNAGPRWQVFGVSAEDIAAHNNDPGAHAGQRATVTETREAASATKLVTPFGLGYALRAIAQKGTSTATDLNDFVTNAHVGWHSFNGGDPPLNAPVAGQGFLNVTRLDTPITTERVLQLWYGVGVDLIYFRLRLSTGTWLPWTKIITQVSLDATPKVKAFGAVASSGSLSTRSVNISSVTKTATGVYQITLIDNVGGIPRPGACVYGNVAGMATAEGSGTTVVIVRTFDTAGVATDKSFAFWAF